MDTENLLDCNRSITVVPSIEESLKTLGLDTELDKNTLKWYEMLKITWTTWRKSPTVGKHFEVFFEANPDPYRTALIFVAKCKDFKDSKPKSLPFFIMESLQNWACNSDSSPEDCLKLPAFRIATEQRNQHFLTLVLKTYTVNTIKETIIPLVKDMIKSDNCKQATEAVIAMKLYEDIPVEDLLFPLILQDKPNIIDEYLTECPNQVRHLVLFLDKLLDKRFNIRNYVQNYIDENKISHIKHEKLHYKPLGKLVARLCNKFNVPIETCKNLSRNRTVAGLRYLIHQKYVDHNISSAVWDDLVKDSLKQNSELATEFIYMVLDHDKKEAAKWVQYLNIPDTNLPHALQKMSLCKSISTECENWDKEEHIHKSFYELTLPADRVIVINTPESFYDLVTTYLVNCNVVSIDCEWKPSFGATQSQVALIQIAVENYVYLIDTLMLNKPSYVGFWITLNKILDNAEIIKLGFGLEQDLKEIKASVLGLSNIKVKGEGLLDLSVLWKTLVNSGLVIQSSSTNGGNSLSSLVQICFGLPLQKSEQCSNWEIRPLRETQIQYAALDAHVLVEIYNFLQRQCLEQGISFEDICNDIMLDKKTKSIKKVKSFAPNTRVKTVDHVKFFVDFKLMNLIPYLRYFGLDTQVLSESLLWHDIINLAISEDRYILLAKHKHTPNKNYPQKYILELGKCCNIQGQLEKIKSYYNIQISSNDLAKRCINCNDLDLKKLTIEGVKELCIKYQKSGKMINNENYIKTVDDVYDTCYNNFFSDSDGDDDISGPVNGIPTNNLCLTSKGVPIEIQNVHKLIESPQAAIICESCGRLFWEGDELCKVIKNKKILSIADCSMN